MAEQWLDVSEAAEKTHIPAETVRRYIREHGVHLRIKKSGKYYYIHEESLDVIKQIRQLYSDGKKKNEIEESLSAAGIPMTVTVNHDGEQMTVNVADELLEIKKELFEQRQHNEKQQQFLMQLLHELATNREVIGALQNRIESSSDERVNERLEMIQEQLSAQKDSHEQMMNEKLEQFQQAQIEVAAAQEEEKRHERVTDMITRRRVESQLRKEALEAWSNKPESERKIRTGLFRKEEDINKRDIFIEDYINEHIEERIKREYDLQ